MQSVFEVDGGNVARSFDLFLEGGESREVLILDSGGMLARSCIPGGTIARPLAVVVLFDVF